LNVNLPSLGGQARAELRPVSRRGSRSPDARHSAPPPLRSSPCRLCDHRRFRSPRLAFPRGKGGGPDAVNRPSSQEGRPRCQRPTGPCVPRPLVRNRDRWEAISFAGCRATAAPTANLRRLFAIRNFFPRNGHGGPDNPTEVLIGLGRPAGSLRMLRPGNGADFDRPFCPPARVDLVCRVGPPVGPPGRCCRRRAIHLGLRSTRCPPSRTSTASFVAISRHTPRPL